jgi:signal transduction histidine kinase
MYNQLTNLSSQENPKENLQENLENTSDIIVVEDRAFHLLDETVPAPPICTDSAWKVIIVDDERYIHQVTRLSLRRFTFEDRPLSLISAYSAAEAKNLIGIHTDTAIILLDVVMETSVAGLEVARYIRKDLRNQSVRIILRTGQPGEAPEEAVILNYDINDYTTKVELTQQKLTTAIITALRSYRDVTKLQQNQRQLITLSKSLQNVCGNLEQLVEERTNELAEKNRLLEQEISDRLKIEKSLREAKIAADKANAAKGEFLANMSHELRTPLNAILGFSQLIESDSALSAEHRDALKIVSSNGKHLLNLLNDILDMSKIEAGQQLALHQASFNLKALLHEVTQLLEIRALAKQVDLLLECSPNLPLYITADENKLRQTLINLVGNAVKFTSEGFVTLRVFLEPKSNLSELHFEIEDTGYGIATEEFDQLFQLFCQTESGRKSRQGTGLGLSISRHFVQLMGGDIQVQSCLGQGSTFSFYIQLGLAERNSEPASVTANNLPYGDMRLLVAHPPEQPLFLPYLISILGMQIRSCFATNEMLQIWQDWHPHLILVDLELSDLDLAIKQISNSERSPTKLVAMVNQLSDLRKLGLAYDSGLVKPIQEKVLAKKIEQLLCDCF